MKRLIVMLFASASLHADSDAIQQALTHFGMSNIEIADSPIAGLKTVLSDQGLLYASEDGRYFIQGHMVHLNAQGEAIDISNQPLMGRLEALQNEMIVYPAEQEQDVITVFFDVSCHYCQKLHQDVPELNKRGITVRYLAFPRQGMNSANARIMEAIFSAADPKKALAAADKNTLEEMAVNKVRRHYQLGLQFGVQGTPAIITRNGELIGGYMKPHQLAEHIKQKGAL